MKYFMVKLDIQHGDFEYRHQFVQDMPGNKKFNAEKYAKNFYGCRSRNQDDWYAFNDGEVLVAVNSCEEITKEEYDVMAKYL